MKKTFNKGSTYTNQITYDFLHPPCDPPKSEFMIVKS